MYTLMAYLGSHWLSNSHIVIQMLSFRQNYARNKIMKLASCVSYGLK